MSRPELIIISAVGARTRLIGHGMSLPWRIPEDLKRFKSLTSGHPIIMGKRTFESLLHQNGGPLPARRNIVLAHSNEWPQWDNVEVYPSAERALDAVADAEKVFITGGASVYAHFLERVDRLELTLVEGDFEGDVFFPEYEHLIGTMYCETARETGEGFAFVTYKRI